MILLLTLLGCQEPFGSDRHTLEDFRVAGMGLAQDGSGSLHGHALLVDRGRLWADSRTDLAWAWLARDDDPADWTGTADAAGPWPELDVPTDGGTLLLVAVSPGGVERRAVLELEAQPAELPSVAPLAPAVLPWTLSSLEDEDLALESRSTVTGPADWTVAPDGFLRLSESSPGDGDLRWMGTHGTWLELDPTTADWTPGSLVLDDGEIEETERGRAGIRPLVALRPTETAGGAWRVHDVFVGDAARTDGAWVGGRWIPGAIEGWQVAQLVLDDTVPAGLSAQGAIPAADPLLDWEPGASCADPPLFDPAWLLSQRCLRTDFTEGLPVAFLGQSTSSEASP